MVQMSKKTMDHTNHVPLSASEKVLKVIANIFMGILALLAILPCVHIVAKSLSSGSNVTAGYVTFWPLGFQTETLSFVLSKTPFLTGLKNSLVVTIAGTAISMITTVTTAFPLSKPSFKGRRAITLLYVISMVFFGGMIPAYMVVRSLGILDTYAACILPFAIIQFDMFIVKSYFEGLPESVEESARLDGAGDLRTLCSIVVPMSKPVIATVSLLYAITYWNNYFHAMMYTRSANMQTLQVYLETLISNSNSYLENMRSGNSMLNVTSDGMIAAAVTLSIVPIVLLYPFVARFMVQGITIGSVKG